MKTIFIAPEEWSTKLHVLEASPDEYARKFEKSSGVSSAKATISSLVFITLVLAIIGLTDVNVFITMGGVLATFAAVAIIGSSHTREKGNRTDLNIYRERSGQSKTVVLRKNNPVWDKAKTAEKLISKISRKRVRLQKENRLVDDSIGLDEIERVSLSVLAMLNEPENKQCELNFSESLVKLKEVHRSF